MFWNKKNKIKKQAHKIDRLVTGLIIWWAVASIVWISKKRKNKNISKNVTDKSTKIVKKWYSFFGKFLVGILKIFSKK